MKLLKFPAASAVSASLGLTSGGPAHERGDSGQSLPVGDRPPQAYVFEDGKLTTFPIEMAEDSLGELNTDRMKSVSDVIAFFRRFEVKRK